MTPKWGARTPSAGVLMGLQILAVVVSGVAGINMMDELRVTHQQKASIDKLRQQMLPHITENFMKEDLFLVKWLRATNWDINTARRRLMETITWRRTNNVATIHQEYFDDLEDELPYMVTFDKQGQPVYIAYAGEWDIRGVIITGRDNRGLRYITRLLELGSRRVREMQYAGKNVSRLSLILDLSGFNLIQHTCPRCLLRIVDFVRIYSAHYTGVADKVIAINAPPTIATALELIKQNLDAETRNIFHIYGFDKAVWQKRMLELIEADKLPERLGGTMVLEKYN